MTQEISQPENAAQQRQRALAKWDNEGGAGGGPQKDDAASVCGSIAASAMTDTERIALHSRVIALENLVMSLLATATEQQLELVRDVANYIVPRPGFTRHPLTIHAAVHMHQLLDRAALFRGDETT
jgi:hypothetical protein